MVSTLKLPVGIDSFEKIRRNNFYYIDKTKLIEQLVETGGEVTLFTRPRRFGKTLNMSMLKSFLRLARMSHCLMERRHMADRAQGNMIEREGKNNFDDHTISAIIKSADMV